MRVFTQGLKFMLPIIISNFRIVVLGCILLRYLVQKSGTWVFDWNFCQKIKNFSYVRFDCECKVFKKNQFGTIYIEPQIVIYVVLGTCTSTLRIRELKQTIELFHAQETRVLCYRKKNIIVGGINIVPSKQGRIVNGNGAIKACPGNKGLFGVYKI